ncbi:hypothetical protein ABB37_09311 [Leptomonas pyrrhocoris]|uniref:Uncharacterized protein n=1 Tax=Leptomonas pyrrhocoris TaxID=157538 RepID=A0A0N1J4A4_LEPPY|nr:hypothetical protein ABB37_09311 [Leptomonas pyrrhocoris]KPA74324.1 hypothetical protein ABB37_09311 [Leptomonas pyrrhocoris]|eukprot:XP_015652763.1 hypothetical protein ABB37_09311 [Leptomonas pyrrhocoris]
MGVLVLLVALSLSVLLLPLLPRVTAAQVNEDSVTAEASPVDRADFTHGTLSTATEPDAATAAGTAADAGAGAALMDKDHHETHTSASSVASPSSAETPATPGAVHDKPEKIEGMHVAEDAVRAHVALSASDTASSTADDELPGKPLDAGSADVTRASVNEAVLTDAEEKNASLAHLRHDSAEESRRELPDIQAAGASRKSVNTASGVESNVTATAPCDVGTTATAAASFIDAPTAACEKGAYASTANTEPEESPVETPPPHASRSTPQTVTASSPVLDEAAPDAGLSSKASPAPQDQQQELPLHVADRNVESPPQHDGAVDQMGRDLSSPPPSEAPATFPSARHDVAGSTHEESASLHLTEAERGSKTAENSDTITAPAPASSEAEAVKEQEEEPSPSPVGSAGLPGAAAAPTGRSAHATQQQEHAVPVEAVSPPSRSEALDNTPETVTEATASSTDQPEPASPPETAGPVAPEIFISASEGVADGSSAPAAATADPHGWADSVRENESTMEQEAADASAPHASAHAVLAVAAEDHVSNAAEVSSIPQTPPSSFAEAPPRHRAAPPSRLALSYLYYRALEALYVEENATLFVRRARDAAPYGHARLNWLLGVLHAYGVGVPRSEREALMYYSFAAMEGVPEAHMALGYRYRNGLGVQASCEAALAHYREAADAVAMTYDGSAADLEGRSVTDLVGARTLLSGGRSVLSFFTYRDNMANSDRMNQAQRDLLSLIYQADRGSRQALLTLGYVYLKGSHQVRRDGRRAEGYLKQAAAKGVAEAHGALGNLYTAGDASIDPPLPRDLARAYHHYRLGAAQKDAVSLNGIGFLHAIGYLDNDARHAPPVSSAPTDNASSPSHTFGADAAHPPDFASAARYFEQSRSPESIYNLAVLHLYGRGVAQDRAAAQRLFWNAAHGGSVLARWQLAHLIDDVAEQDAGKCERALELYKETASYGSWNREMAGGGGSGAGGLGASAASSAPVRGPGSDADVNEEGSADGASGDAHATDPARTGGGHGKSSRATDADASSYNDGPSAPHTNADYERLLSHIRSRLQAVEESLRLSDSEDGPAVVSLASFVELLSLAETGDASSTWLAARFVEDYLEVEVEKEEEAAPVEGEVALLWPAPSSSVFLSPAAARSELLFYLLQRTVLHPRHRGGAHGAAFLRLGDFFYYGEAPRYGVDMARAMEYYRLAADIYHDPQALFNVGFMYQLGLHRAPHATLLSAENDSNESPAGRGGVWKVHSDPPYYLTGAPSVFLAAQAAARAWDRSSSSPTSRGVNVYLAWRYYTESLRREGRGWMAVQFALLTVNAQWSLRHFGLSRLLPALPSSPGFAFPLGGSSLTLSDGEEDSGVGTDVAQAFLRSLTTVLHAEVSFVYAVLADVATALVAWCGQVEQVVLYGAVGVFVLALLVRHHAV